MSFLLHDPMLRPLDDNGEPMPGCYMQFDQTQTTTPATVYADAALSTPLSNPVVSNSAGVFPAIYGDSAIVYRRRLYTAEGVLVSDTDPMHPHVAFPPGTVVMFDGSAEDRDAAYPPALWEVMDGDNGTKDARDAFPIGVSNTKPISGAGSTGGSFSVTSDPGGAHDHGGQTGETVLDETHMPEHHHELWCWTAGSQTSGEVDSVNAPGKPGGFPTVWFSGGSSRGYAEKNSGDDQLVKDAGNADPVGHDHDIDAASDHTHGVTVTPPYFTVWFLRRKSA